MGEIGISRHEFLYEMRWWEILMASRGYNNRNILTHQLLRLTAYSAFYAFRENKDGKEPEDWQPMWFDLLQDDPAPVTQEDVDDLKGLMSDINSHKVVSKVIK